MHTLTNWRKNMHFPPFFSSPFNHFFPPSCHLAIFFLLPPGGRGQTEKYTPLDYSNLKLFLSSHIFLNPGSVVLTLEDRLSLNPSCLGRALSPAPASSSPRLGPSGTSTATSGPPRPSSTPPYRTTFPVGQRQG